MKQEATLSPAILVPVMYVTRGDVTQQQTNKTKISFASAWMWRDRGREPGRTGGGRGTGDGRRKGGKRKRNSKGQTFVVYYCLSSSQKHEASNVF